MSLIATDNKRIVVGLGATGISCVRHLAKLGVPFVVADNREQPPALDEMQRDYPHIEMYLGEFDKQLFCSADELIVSPGVALDEPAIERALRAGVSISGDIDLFAVSAKAPIIAITGSNGKSTVTTLVGEMAKAAGIRVGVGGNLGEPALNLLADDIEMYVLELSSFQLERCKNLNAQVACVLNVSPDHMDRYVDLQAYHRAKHRIFIGAKTAIVNRDESLSQPLLTEGMGIGRFGLGQPDLQDYGVIKQSDGDYLAFGVKPLLPISEIKIAGRHNLSNVLAALAIAHMAGINQDAALTAVKNFHGLAHRCQYVATIKGVNYYNDSKGTNVGATIAAVQGVCASDTNTNQKVVLILGGVTKGADFSPLRATVERYARACVLIGEGALELNEVLSGLTLVEVVTMSDAVHTASQLAESGDIVLLSPACASFDMFSSYAQRGEVFSAAVMQLAQQASA
jgi:UDP-N-acetylmuramoylalanine--D-glutamate ligase